MRKKDLLAALVVLCLALFSGFAWAGKGQNPAVYIDVHTHLVPGEVPAGVGGPGRDEGSPALNSPRRPSHPRDRRAVQRSPRGDRHRDKGRAGDHGDYEAAAESLVAVLDRLGVGRAIVMPPPQTKNQPRGYTYREILPALRRHPDRLILGAGGGTLNPLIQTTGPDEVTGGTRDAFDRMAGQIVSDGAGCFGEMTALHISYSETHVFEECPPDHPLFLQLADLSAQYGIPIDLHMDCVPQDMATPRLWVQRSSRNPKRLNANIPGLERLLAHNRKAGIVWQHVGRDTMNQLTPELVRRLVSRHPNLYCAVWIRPRGMPAAGGPPGENQIVDERYRIKDAWLRLFEDYPDRFMIGTDGFFASSTEDLDTSVESTWRFLDMLPQGLARKIGGENAARVYGL